MGKYLITGMSGSLARLVARRFVQLGHEVVGADYRPAPADLPEGVRFYQGNYNKTRFEDVMRREVPDGIVHLGRVGNLKMQLGKRFDLNVIGTGKVMELALKYAADRLLVLSTFHIYGAHPHNHIPIFEEEPIRAGATFPEIADAIQLDNLATQWCYRHPGLKTVVLRPCNVVGPNIQNAISRYLRYNRLGYILGFSPMWQFIHQDDLVDAIVAVYFSDEVGVFNVAGKGAIPLARAFSVAKKPLVPIPGPLASAYLTMQKQFGQAFPTYLLDFFKYPVVISDQKLRNAVGYEARVGAEEAIHNTIFGVPDPFN